jgi:hypothetical protein
MSTISGTMIPILRSQPSPTLSVFGPSLPFSPLLSLPFSSVSSFSPAADTHHLLTTVQQDVTSYVIARTLGDPTASTSHKSSFATQLSPPKSDSNKIIPNADDSTGLPTVLADPGPDPDTIPVGVAALRSEEDESHSGISTKPGTTPAPIAIAVPGTGTGATTSSSRAFFVDGEGSEDDGAARLAGVGVFSPVASMPGSPVVSRRNFFEKDGEDDAGGSGSGSSVASGTDESGSPPFAAPRGVLLVRCNGGCGGGGTVIHHHQHHHHHHHQHQHHQGGREAETEEEHEHSHSASDGGGGGVNGDESTSGESSFAILDREESFEDAGVHIRRRVPGAGAPGDDE